MPSRPPSSSILPTPTENGADLDSHDPGFLVYPDPLSTIGVGIGTPKSRRTTSDMPPPPLAMDAGLHIPSSPSSSIASSIKRLEDQENIPPSLSSTPAKASTPGSTKTAKSKSGGAWYDDDETIAGVQGVVGIIVAESSGARGISGSRRTGKSKLAQVIAGEMEEDPEEGEDDGEELTPGRSLGVRKGKGKERMTQEVEG